jgi:hypothetical protein
MRVSEKLAHVRPMNFAPPGGNFAPRPGRNSASFDPPPSSNREPANDLQQPGGAKLPEFRPTTKRKKYRWGNIQKPTWRSRNQNDQKVFQNSLRLEGWSSIKT